MEALNVCGYKDSSAAANPPLFSFLIPTRALIQNLDFSNSSVCGEAAGESYLLAATPPHLNPEHKALPTNQMIII